MKKPVIGITAAYVKQNEFSEGVYVHHDYHRAVAANGGIPIVLPFMNPDMALEMLALCDGVILSGGEDVDPSFYGQDPNPNLGKTIPERDAAEIAIANYVLENNIPVLAICRGVQLLNVALGGTLIQDIPSEVSGAIQHAQKADRGRDSHWAEVSPESLLYEIVGAERIRVNSLHHQALDKIADGLQVVAAASDGIVEAVEYKKPSTFTLGVQWHPESMASSNEQMNAIFARFVASCVKSPAIEPAAI